MLKKFFQILCTGFVAIVAMFVWAISFGDHGLWQQHRLERQIEHLSGEVDSLQIELENRAKEAERLQRDSFYIESIARTQYGMSRKGEVAFRFVETAPGNLTK